MKTIEIGSSSLRVNLSSLGASVLNIVYNKIPVALSYSTPGEAEKDQFYLGATVGPICNRIAHSLLEVGGVKFQLPANEGDHCLHSGGRGFDKRNWRLEDHGPQTAKFALDYDLSDIGMSGHLRVTAVYHVDDDELSVIYRGQCDQDTYVNITNHVYLNLGNVGNPIDDHEFTLHGKNYVEVNSQSIPTGRTQSLATPLNYRIGDRSKFDGGVDHHFNVADDEDVMRTMMEAHANNTQLALRVRSNAPGYQFYTAKFLQAPFVPSGGFCVETQYAPDAINQERFFSPVLIAGKSFERRTTYEFFRFGK